MTSLSQIPMNHNNHLVIEKIMAYHRFRARRRNPIFLFGPSRSGKTTILKAIEDYFSGRKGMRVLRSDAEDMVAKLIKSIRDSGNTEGFYDEFRDYDALLVDNIWVLQGKPRTVREIFRFFKTLVDKRKLVIIALDMPPEALSQDSKTTKELRERSITLRMKPYDPSK